MPAPYERYGPRPAAPPRPVFRLAFALPPALQLVAPGRHQPAPDGCQLVIDPTGLVQITAPSRLQVLEHAGRFLKNIAKNRGGPIVITGATLVTPPNYYPGEAARGGRDGYTIVIGAEVSFSPTTVGVEVVPAAVAGPA